MKRHEYDFLIESIHKYIYETYGVKEFEFNTDAGNTRVAIGMFSRLQGMPYRILVQVEFPEKVPSIWSCLSSFDLYNGKYSIYDNDVIGAFEHLICYLKDISRKELESREIV